MSVRFNGPYKLGGIGYGIPQEKEIGKVYFHQHPDTEFDRKHNADRVGKINQCGYICPCGCGRHVCITFGEQWGPGQNWSYKIHPDETISFHPSVHSFNACGAHYFIRNGIVEWC